MSRPLQGLSPQGPTMAYKQYKYSRKRFQSLAFTVHQLLCYVMIFELKSVHNRKKLYPLNEIKRKFHQIISCFDAILKVLRRLPQVSRTWLQKGCNSKVAGSIPALDYVS